MKRIAKYRVGFYFCCCGSAFGIMRHHIPVVILIVCWSLKHSNLCDEKYLFIVANSFVHDVFPAENFCRNGSPWKDFKLNNNPGSDRFYIFCPNFGGTVFIVEFSICSLETKPFGVLKVSYWFIKSILLRTKPKQPRCKLHFLIAPVQQ